jgi:hypothetical protein
MCVSWRILRRGGCFAARVTSQDEVGSRGCAGKIPVESYMITARGIVVAGVCLLLCAVLVARTPQASSGHEVSGVYAIQRADNAGSDVNVTLHVVLSSSTDATLQSKSVSLRSLLSSTMQDLSASFTIPAHGNADFSAGATISAAEYKLWQEGGKPMLVLSLKALDGSEFTRTVALLPTVHAEAK